MKGLTVWQPWAHCIVHCEKDVENRTWAPPIHVVGQRIAIHAGKVLDPDAVARLVAAGRLVKGEIHGAPLGAVIGTARLEGSTRASRSWWAEPDMTHWLLADVRRLREPVPCRGAQGLWDLPADVERLVLEREVPWSDELSSEVKHG